MALRGSIDETKVDCDRNSLGFFAAVATLVGSVGGNYLTSVLETLGFLQAKDYPHVVLSIGIVLVVLVVAFVILERRSAPDLVALTKEEEAALGVAVTDPRAGDRGVWLYPLHQDLTNRGLSDAEATMTMNSLVAKGMCKQIDVPTHDSLTGKETTAPAYRVTPKGFSYVKSSSELSKSKQTHYYHVRVRGTRSVNDIFLRHLQGLRGVQRQTRFITEDDPEFSKIAIFSYKPIDSDLIRDMARMFNVIVDEITEG